MDTPTLDTLMNVVGIAAAGSVAVVLLCVAAIAVFGTYFIIRELSSGS